MSRLNNPSQSFQLDLAGRTFTATIYRGSHQHSDTMRLCAGDDRFITRRWSLGSNGHYVLMREGTDEFLWHQGVPVQVYWFGDVIEEVTAPMDSIDR